MDSFHIFEGNILLYFTEGKSVWFHLGRFFLFSYFLIHLWCISVTQGLFIEDGMWFDVPGYFCHTIMCVALQVQKQSFSSLVESWVFSWWLVNICKLQKQGPFWIIGDCWTSGDHYIKKRLQQESRQRAAAAWESWSKRRHSRKMLQHDGNLTEPPREKPWEVGDWGAERHQQEPRQRRGC